MLLKIRLFFGNKVMRKECLMTLSPERIGQIALMALQSKLEEGGLNLNPKEIRRQIANQAKQLGIPANEMAEFAKIVIETAYKKVLVELDQMSVRTPQDEKK
ncbi:hypothetical protein EPO17_01310 [Patescibacteria group bacterium]|nr:MAG: hypothetical protein EPO17_01310 [Patescibacteria group bacterium]